MKRDKPEKEPRFVPTQEDVDDSRSVVEEIIKEKWSPKEAEEEPKTRRKAAFRPWA